jgi:hypothetical protein
MVNYVEKYKQQKNLKNENNAALIKTRQFRKILTKNRGVS